MLSTWSYIVYLGVRHLSTLARFLMIFTNFYDESATQFMPMVPYSSISGCNIDQPSLVMHRYHIWLTITAWVQHTALVVQEDPSSVMVVQNRPMLMSGLDKTPLKIPSRPGMFDTCNIHHNIFDTVNVRAECIYVILGRTGPTDLQHSKLGFPPGQ